MTRHIGTALILLAIALGMTPFIRAYEHKLDSRTVREAYFLAEDESQRKSVLADYVYNYTCRTVLCVDNILVSTPFHAVVQRAADVLPNYDAAQAEREFAGQAQPLAVEVTIRVPTRTDRNFQPDFWREFHVSLVQDGETIQPLSRTGHPLYLIHNTFLLTPVGSGQIAAFRLRLAYNPDQVASSRTRIVVEGPEGTHEEAEFDLDRLR